MTEPLDLDKAELRLTSEHYSDAGWRRDFGPALIAEVRRLREETARVEGEQLDHVARKALATNYVPAEEVKSRDARIETLEVAGDALAEAASAHRQRAREAQVADTNGTVRLAIEQWQELRKREK